MESLRTKWEDAKATKLKYYIDCLSEYKTIMCIGRIQPYLITNKSSNALRALALHHTRPHKLGNEVASWNQNATNLRACKV